jgi:predicted peptidase
MIRTVFFCVVFILAGSVGLHAQELPEYEAQLFVQEEDTLPYRILLPQNFDPEQEYPLLLVLHGAGERGKDNEAQLTHGSKLFLQEKLRRDYPAVVVFPQCPKHSYWSNVTVKRDTLPLGLRFHTDGEPTEAMNLLLGLLQDLKERPYIDKKKLYVGGLSMGGMGTLELLRREPNTFAAAFAICGGDDIQNAKKYRRVPLWLFHGVKDDVVPVQLSQSLADQLEKIGAKNIKLTLYPEVKHNSWDNAFAEPNLLPWLFSKKK